MNKEIGYCPFTTMKLVETNMELLNFYHDKSNLGESQEMRLSLIFNAVVLSGPENSEHVRKYNELSKEFQFYPEKMQRFLNQDAMLRFVVKDMVSNGHEKEDALQITFNSYVLEDFIMRDIYKTL
ncbi:hypothetical protein [Sporosarcina sp. FSL K6-1508]|uniref:hypothetical protein n=1 Tax=Sporosarcina sp. FSL K6-1508 TaxID=2921553 RepID=UPI0030F65B64